MPEVDGKHVSYTEDGKEAAKKNAKKTGKKVKGYEHGGPVETEDQRSKRMEKTDSLVRGYMGGGAITSPKNYGGGGKVKKYGDG